MTSTSDARPTGQTRVYDRETSVVFLKTKERFGGLSNMAAGFPLRVNGVRIKTSEALYQACRFPHMPEVQQLIIGENSPMTAKMRSKPYRRVSRHDWDFVRVKIMRWSLRVKLAQNWREFGRLLLSTGDRPIVEQSRKDDFWGAKVAEDGTLVGMNVLGRLLMELREQLKGDEAESLRFIEPLAISEFLLFGQPIEAVQAAPNAEIPGWTPRRPSQADTAPPQPSDPQPSLFEQPMISNAEPVSAPSLPTLARDDDSQKHRSDYHPAVRDWLGDLPSRWDVLRSKYLFREIDDRTDTGTETLLSMRQAHGLIPHAKVSTKPVTPEELKGYKRVRIGQMVLNRMQASNGMFAVAREDGLVSPDYAVFQPLRPMEPDYFVDLFKTTIYRAKFRQESKGLGTGMSGFLRLYSDRFGAIHVPQPPEDEQRKIVKFIRAYDLRVRRLIRNKRQLIRLLNEQKLAIINQAVTRGLDLDIQIKPTGIDWMPEVPAHWDVKRLKYLTKFLNGIAFKPADWKDSGVPIIRIENLNGSEKFNYTDRQDLPERMLIEPGDLVFAWSGNRGTSFGSFEWTRDFPAYLNQHIFKLEGYDLHRKYFFYLLRAVTKHVEDNAHGIIGLVHITKPALGAIFVPVASPEEQAAIAHKIDEESAELNQAIEKIASEIRLIGEYRERLIADVVTGKLDVRHIEIAAPADEPILDEDDALEEELEGDAAEVMEGADADE
ncbi:NADAR domain-containing protein [Paracoccus luteus]|uniref:NADAR domain-containing protein n=1 Tax=Paracoccus luteus TaxID=2508543 RepID=UPI00106F4674|nr:NADAR domain-containing protein [Paracoccus luteus]